MVRHALNHIGVVVASKLMPLASLLIYSRFLTPEEYGVASLFFSYIWILGILLTLNLHTAIGRFIYDEKHQSGALIGTTLVSVGGGFGVGLLVAALWLAQVAGAFNLPKASIPFLFAVVAGQVAESLLTQVMTARQQSGRLLVLVAGRSVGSIVATVVIASVLTEERHYAVIYAEGVSNLFLVAVLLRTLSVDRPWVFSKSLLRQFASYSLPLIPYMLSLTLLTQFDRIVIDRLFGKGATGVYSIAFTIGILLVMMAGALLNALNPRFFAFMNKKEYSKVVLDANAVFALCAVGAFAVAAIGPVVASYLIPETYAEGFSLIPMIALGGLASVAFQLWGRLINYANKTYLLSLIAICATAIKIALSLILIPHLGLLGAAITTVIAYAFMSYSTVAIINHRLVLFRVHAPRQLIWFIALAIYVVLAFFAARSEIFEWPLRLMALSGALAFAWQDIRAFIRGLEQRSAETR